MLGFLVLVSTLQVVCSTHQNDSLLQNTFSDLEGLASKHFKIIGTSPTVLGDAVNITIRWNCTRGKLKIFETIKTQIVTCGIEDDDNCTCRFTDDSYEEEYNLYNPEKGVFVLNIKNLTCLTSRNYIVYFSGYKENEEEEHVTIKPILPVQSDETSRPVQSNETSRPGQSKDAVCQEQNNGQETRLSIVLICTFIVVLAVAFFVILCLGKKSTKCNRCLHRCIDWEYCCAPDRRTVDKEVTMEQSKKMLRTTQ